MAFPGNTIDKRHELVFEIVDCQETFDVSTSLMTFSKRQWTENLKHIILLGLMLTLCLLSRFI
jgi:hypothetical protein